MFDLLAMDKTTVNDCPKCSSPSKSSPSPAPPVESYHFESQNVFLSKSDPNFFGTIGYNHIYLIYDDNTGTTTANKPKLIEIYSVCNTSVESNGQIIKNMDLDNGKVDDDIQQSYTLERIIPLLMEHVCDISQVIYSNVADYFAFLLRSPDRRRLSLNNRRQSIVDNLARQSFVHVYTNYRISNVHNVDDYLVRTNQAHQPFPVSNSSQLNIIKLKHFQHQQSLNNASFIYSCLNTGNLLITNSESTEVFLFRMIGQQSEIDFVPMFTIELPWIPKISKLVNNYLAFMSDEHFTLIQIDNLEDRCQSQSLSSEPAEESPFPKGDCQIIYNGLFDDLPPIQSKNSRESTNVRPPGQHAQSVYGPVAEQLACSLKITRHEQIGDNPQSACCACSVLFCRRLSKKFANDLTSMSTNSCPQFYCSDLVQNIKQKNLLWSGCSSSSELATGADIKLLYSFQLLPYNNPSQIVEDDAFESLTSDSTGSSKMYALSLYLLWANRIDCYLVDLRLDTLRLIPVSYLNLNSNPTVINCVKLPDLSPVTKPSKSIKFRLFKRQKKPTNNALKPPHEAPSSPCHRIKPILVKDFSASPANDLLHLLILVESDDGSFTTQLRTYSTDFLPLITSHSSNSGNCKILDRTRPLSEMTRLSSRVFLNLIAAESNEQLVNLVSDGCADSPVNMQQQASDQHTVYGLRRPSIDQQQADLLTAIDDLRSNSECFDPNSHTLHQLYTRLESITRFACQFHAAAYNRSRLNEFARKIESEIELLSSDKQASCSNRSCRFYRGQHNTPKTQ